MLKQLKQKIGDIKENESLSAHTTFKIGGPAKYFYLAKNSNDLLKAIQVAEELKISFFILGWGSNLVVADSGFDGLVIRAMSENLKVEGDKIFVESGVNLSRLVGQTANAGLTGLEFAAGIPGTVGGAVRGNAGAYGQSIGQLITEVEVYQDGKVKKITQAEMQYNYRDSILKHQSGVVLSVTFQLKIGDSQKIHAEILKIIKDRNDKLPFEPSAGCIFKNVELAKIEFDEDKVIKGLDITKEEWQKATEFGKLPVGFILDKLSLKGKTIGGCQVSEKHCAFFINTDQAKAEHVMMLISDIKMRVRNQLVIQLQEEVQYLGF